MVVVKGEGCGEGVPFPVDKWISVRVIGLIDGTLIE